MTLYSIGTVERDTGIKRDTLRVWERRYGFPDPVRNDKGERLYPEEQLRQLQRIRRLLDQGCRAGKLLPPVESHLNELEANLLAVTPSDPDIESILEAVHSGESEQVKQRFRRLFKKHGMEGFIIHTVAPLVRIVGERWASGELDVYEEHFVSQQLIHFVNAEIAKIQITAKKPKVLLATLPGEEHILGLLMVNAMLSAHDVTAISLGAEVPMDQIRSAADKFCVDSVGVSFSSAYQYNQIHDDIRELRDLIPEGVDVWVGGEGVYRLRKLPAGVTKFKSLDGMVF